MNSRAKGCRGEREFAQFLRDKGINARRGQQFSGGTDSPDVVSDLTGVHFEVKRVEQGNLYNWVDQAFRDAGIKLPVVAHKRNNKEWVGILNMHDLINILKVYYGRVND